MQNRKQQHKPAAIRNVGFTAIKFYIFGFIASAIYVLLFTIGAVSNNFTISKGLVTGQYLIVSEPEPAPEQNEISATPEPAAQAAINEPVIKPYILDLPPYDLTARWFSTPESKRNIIIINKRLKANLKAWEQRTGQSIFNQSFMQKNSAETNADSFKYYDQPNAMPALIINNIDNTLSGSYTLERYSDLWNSNYTACEAAEYQEYLREKGNGYNPFLDPNADLSLTDHTQCADDKSRVTATGKGICFDGSTQYLCGQHARDYIERVYYAVTDDNFSTAAPIFHHQSEFNNARIAYELGLPQQTTAEELAVADIYSGIRNSENRFLNFDISENRYFKVETNEEAKPKPQYITSEMPFIERVKFADIKQIEALRVTLLFGSCIILFLYVLIGHKHAIIKTPAFMGKHFYIYSVPFLAAYAFTFINGNGSVFSSMWSAFWLFIPPMLFMTVPVLRLTIVEYIKEMPLYRRWFILGRGGEASRMAGIKDYMDKDLSDYFTAGKLVFKKESSIYLGKTLLENDTKIGGRHVGVTSEQHMITFAATGAGKSRDAVWNTLLNYSGGAIIFDPKGEHFDVTYERRAEVRPAFLLDPYGTSKDKKDSDYWNPLDEIDPESPSARDDLRNMAEASIYMDSGESGSGAFFRENAQLIYRGFLAYVLVKMSPEDRHLGTVYDLMATGEPEGKFASKRSWDTLIQEMMLCDAIAGAPRDAASLLERVGERERGSYISTIVRGIDWVNSPPIRAIICQPSSFSVRDAKTNEASIYLTLPEKFIHTQIRFVRTFYSMAFSFCNNFETPQPTGSKRRVLFLFDEFNKLGEFRPAVDAILTQRSSYLKCWFIQQNLGQLKANYKNVDDFLSSCDKQFFGLDTTDSTVLDLLEKSLGSYTVTTKNDKADSADQNEKHALMTRAELAEFLDIKQAGQIVIPLSGKPLKLNKVPYYKNFTPDQYGKHDF